MKLLALLGLNRRLRRLRIAAAEGALAAEDRAELLRLAWHEERRRLRRLLALASLALGLTTVVFAMLSVAVVVQFWDTPHRTAAAWSVAVVWLLLWLAALLGVVVTLRDSAQGFAAAQRELARDWRWLRQRIGDGAAPAPQPRPAVSREELLARIARQRERIALLEAEPPPAAGPKPPRPDESATDTALRLARENPIAAGALLAGTLAVFGPSRIARLAAWLLPVLWRMRG